MIYLPLNLMCNIRSHILTHYNEFLMQKDTFYSLKSTNRILNEKSNANLFKYLIHTFIVRSYTI